MMNPLKRATLGGTLVGLGLFFGATQLSLAQYPDYTPTGPLAPIAPPAPALPQYQQPANLPPNPQPGKFTGNPTAAKPLAPPQPQGPPLPPNPDDKPKWDLSWANGLFFKTADERFVFHVGGTLHYDMAWYSATPILQFGPGGTGRFNDAANPRRMRLAAEGTLYEAVDFKLEFEFANGIGFSPAGTQNEVATGSVTNSPGPTHAWITVKDVPWLGNVRIGNQKEWFSLEHLNPHKFLEFMERSYLFDFTQLSAFNNGFSPGVSVFRTWADDRVFTAVGGYKNESTLLGFGLNDGDYAVTGRVAALPVWMPDKEMFWHVGGAMSYRDPVNGQVQIRVRDNVRNAPFPLLNLLINTNLLNASSQTLYNVETAAVVGPFTFQAEYTANVLRNASQAATATTPTGPPQGNLFFSGYYVEGLVFLTGESRTWNVKNAFFNRVQPLRPLRLKPSECDGYGFGAWELGVRYTYLDVSNKAIQAGRLDSVTLGLNWYLNANAKMQFNYDYTHRGDTNNPAQGHIHAFGTRMALDF